MQDKYNISSIRIVSDSLTVLKWLDGTYVVKNKSIKYLLDDIHWMIATFQDELQDWEGIRFQWVNSHQGTRGNEFVDQLAKDGMNLISDKYRYPIWQYFSKKAVNTEIKHYWQEIMEKEYQSWISL